MEKKLRAELVKMAVIMAVLIGLGIYAHEFVIDGIKAKMALNLSIFAIFGVAAGIAFRNVLSLRNEVVALRALQVDYGERAKRPRDPYAQPAVVFSEPELLGQGYRLIAEELGKQDNLEIGADTVQTLLHDVDQRINDRKSTILYFSGLMVFLGLLGAFMGLMKTVHSVSDLIGAMDLSGAAGADSFGKMIEGMKAPLNGMSVGFSSSLFGLMTSMVLGALERCMTSAMKTLRNEFEHWLSNLAQLESGQSEAVASPSRDFGSVRRAIEAGAAELAELRAAIIGLAHGAEASRAEIVGLAGAVGALSDVVADLSDPRRILRPVADAVAELAHNQSAMLAQITTLHEDAAADRAHIRATLAALGVLAERSAVLDGDEIHRQLDNLITLSGEAQQLPRVSPELRETASDAPPSLMARLAASLGLSPRSPARRQLVEARRLRREVHAGLAANRRAMRELGARLDRRLERLAVAEAHHRDAIARLAMRSAEHRASFETFAAAFEAGSPSEADAIALGDARTQMDRLRRRLGMRFEDPAPEQPASAIIPSTPQRGAL
ncbi:hypothetical protein [Novosphingobium sp.]|uniref:hypothetical protein n=1 Tax=Novosphingobium sp. TaxID=1874826 RepID=UPI00262F28A2|nr:hypothetical protein [Novosphingobium sp.]